MARRPSRTVGDLGGDDLSGAALTERTQRSAAVTVADRALAHSCALDPDAGVTVCRRRGHQRDAAAARTVLEALGLAGQPEPADFRVIAPARRPSQPRPDLSWQDRAACRGRSLWLFFGAEGERQAERAVRERNAQHVCRQCPVRAACLDYAVTAPERSGIWGGLNEDDRQAERRRRMRRAS